MEKDLTSIDAGADSATAYEELEDADVTHVFGEFSFVTYAQIEESIVRSVHIGRTNVCNLLGCTYLDAAGVSVLIRARRALGPAFSIVAPETGIVRRVLELMELIKPDPAA
jgi:anti-anti-sigma regulatory factor